MGSVLPRVGVVRTGCIYGRCPRLDLERSQLQGEPHADRSRTNGCKTKAEQRTRDLSLKTPRITKTYVRLTNEDSSLPEALAAAAPPYPFVSSSGPTLTKRRYPLADAKVQGADGTPLQMEVATGSKVDDGTGFTSEPYFVVWKHDLAVIRPCEIVSWAGSFNSAEEAQNRIATILGGPRLLSEELQVQLYVFRETDSESTDVVHLMVLAAHCVTDGVANNAFPRCSFKLDTLARGGEPELAQLPLEERLAMAIPSMDLHLRSLNPARGWWPRAVGIVIFRLMMAKRQVGASVISCGSSYRRKQTTTVGRPYTSVVASRVRHHMLPHDPVWPLPRSRTRKPLL